ncbi:TRAF3-interacting protein 1-like [Accipiter gentilis]|uniref:TRAF3-interacting protein 1-like n=1 Tax=Astur gentilis TaxID=8957 RepID=UPI0021105940|nr:TRAF3-interacting protein 1-like [Accipiter gentilis]
MKERKKEETDRKRKIKKGRKKEKRRKIRKNGKKKKEKDGKKEKERKKEDKDRKRKQKEKESQKKTSERRPDDNDRRTKRKARRAVLCRCPFAHPLSRTWSGLGWECWHHGSVPVARPGAGPRGVPRRSSGLTPPLQLAGFPGAPRPRSLPLRGLQSPRGRPEPLPSGRRDARAAAPGARQVRGPRERGSSPCGDGDGDGTGHLRPRREQLLPGPPLAGSAAPHGSRAVLHRWPGDRHIDMKGVLLLPTGAGCPAADG